MDGNGGEGPKHLHGNDQPTSVVGTKMLLAQMGLVQVVLARAGALILGNGGSGAAGAGWVRFRQGAISGGGDVLDITRPPADNSSGKRTYS